MKLIPREQWICDACGEIIENAAHGWLEFLTDDESVRHRFRIVHHVSYSPRNPNRPNGAKFKNQTCYDEVGNTSGDHLNHIVNAHGIPLMLGMLDVGPDLNPKYTGPRANVREWVELMKRLTIPLYEEARLYWSAARADGMFDGENEVSLYSERVLIAVIDKYGNDGGDFSR